MGQGSAASSVISILVSAGFALAPSLSFFFQWRKCKQGHSAEGFSSKVTLVLLAGHILRVFFWMAKRFDVTLLVQSVIMIAVQLLLVEALVSAKGNKKKDNRTHTSAAGSSASVTSKATPVDDFLRNFWEWDDLFTYFGVIAAFTAVLGGVSSVGFKHEWYVESLGSAAVICESLLAVPQLMRSFKEKSTEGLSLEMVMAWLGGDFGKGLYLFSTGAPAQFLLGTGFQLLTDILLTLQLFVLYPSKESLEVLERFAPALAHMHPARSKSQD